MKAIIIEDEKRAIDNLKRLLGKLDPEIEVIAEIATIDNSIKWFNNNPMPDIVFLDIHLADGSSFEIFKEIDIESPIIFTTAYDEYALKAFEVNSIDYLLKPINKEKLQRALSKIKMFTHTKDVISLNNSNLIKALTQTLRNEPNYKTSILVIHKDKLIPVHVENIAYIYTEHKIVKVVTLNNTDYVIDQSLEKLSQQLDPGNFFRVNRQYFVSRNAIKDASIWFSGQLSLNLKIQTQERIVVSRSNVKSFKIWLTT
ncbi:MAG: LytTR family DNA-binding domain-containing protein [Bacteroidales bacterium]|jgi:two-component system LytT family response regulator|nr:LytTR family DNA-binding domain-containing protein [Bacteroidales bacterium]